MPIKIKSLKTLSDSFVDNKYIYKDLTLDISIYIYDSPGIKSTGFSKDIKVSYDSKAITNSLLNLFNTRPGQRFLFPEYGLSLLPYVFLQITAENGELIGNAIMSGIRRFEPRVDPIRIMVNADPDNNQYTFDIFYEIPMLGITNNSQFLLHSDNRTFITLTTTR